ncbi:MAG: HD domain-containing protein [Clostridia bacterium]|nr:HD domain-containing protein [Clostridia bacterium]
MENLYLQCYKLKNILRRGWILRELNVERFESDAEHIFSCCILAIEIMEKEKLCLNQEKVLKMILFHEFGEILAGDITPNDNVSKEDKYAKEKECIESFSKDFDMTQMLELWLEFEEGKTKEATFCKAMDKLDAVMQARVYSNQFDDDSLFEEFYKHSEEIIKDYKKYLNF